MIRDGIRTGKGIAFPGVLFMIIASFLFIQAVYSHQLMAEDVKQYGRITCMMEAQEINDLAIPYLDENHGSYIYEREEIFQYQSMEKEYPVTGISSTMMVGEVLAGSVYSDEDSGLAILVNKELLMDLAGKTFKTDEEMEDWISKTITVGSCGVKICGVLDDKSMTPRGYMSIPAICSYIQQQGEIPQAGIFCISVSELDQLEQLQLELGEAGIGTDIDQEKMLEWKLKQVENRDLHFMSLISLSGFISCTLLTIKMKNQQSNSMNKIALVIGVVTNVLAGLFAGWMVFSFVQMWQL